MVPWALLGPLSVMAERCSAYPEPSQSFYTCSKLSTGMPNIVGSRAFLSA